MKLILETLLFLVIVSAAPVIIYLSIRTRNKKLRTIQAEVTALAEELGGQYTSGGAPFESNAIGAFKKATMRHVISFPEAGSVAKFFVMHPFTGEGSKTTAYKYIAHRMYFTIPVHEGKRDHVYLSSKTTDLAKKTPGSLTNLNIPTDNLQLIESPIKSHTAYAVNGRFSPSIFTSSLLNTINRHFFDCDIELVAGNLYVIGFCGNKIEKTEGYKPFIEKCRQHISTIV